MSSYSGYQSNGSSGAFKVCFVLALVVSFSLVLLYLVGSNSKTNTDVVLLQSSNLSDHAVLKHGDEAVLVDQCLSKNGPIGTWKRESDGRFALPCVIPDVGYGVKINECNGNNCTSFIKNKASKIIDLLRYLKNSGYDAFDKAAQELMDKYAAYLEKPDW